MHFVQLRQNFFGLVWPFVQTTIRANSQEIIYQYTSFKNSLLPLQIFEINCFNAKAVSTDKFVSAYSFWVLLYIQIM